MYDPSIGQESLTTIDVIGVVVGHIIFGFAATLLFDWSWIPLSPQQKNSGRSLKDIKRGWGWEEKIDTKTEQKSSSVNEKFVVEDDS